MLPTRLFSNWPQRQQQTSEKEDEEIIHREEEKRREIVDYPDDYFIGY
jgi:hypothetical protein